MLFCTVQALIIGNFWIQKKIRSEQNFSYSGPNGSGKSNVIDSMLFVFGYRANKIRNKKVSGLIHKSENFPDIRQATVEVHFCMINDHQDSKHGFDVIPNSEFTVSRTAYKDNSS